MEQNTQALDVRIVPFMDAELMAARDEDGQIWAGVRWMCNGIGFSKGQMQRQVTNIGVDRVLSEGVAKLQLPTNGGVQDVLCLKLDYVPLWLAKISITQNMKQEHPELAERLKQYQLKAKDVLAAAFLPSHTQQQVEDDFSIVSRALLILNKRTQEQAVQIDALETRIEAERPWAEFARSVSECTDTVTVGQYAKILFRRNGINIGRNRLYEWLREHDYLSERNEPYQIYVAEGLFVVKLTHSKAGVYPVTLITGKGMVKLFPQLNEWWNELHPNTVKRTSGILDDINRYIIDAKAKGYSERKMAEEIGTIGNVAVHRRIVKLRKAGLLDS